MDVGRQLKDKDVGSQPHKDELHNSVDDVAFREKLKFES